MADLTAAGRQHAADQGHALPDGSYPIHTRRDLAKAIHAYGRATPSKKPQVKAHIRKRARALDATHLLPDNWC